MSQTKQPPSGGFALGEGLPQAQVIRSRRRTMAIEIHADGRVLLRLPMRADEAQVRAFLQRVGPRLHKRLQEVAARPRVEEPTPQQVAAYKARARAELPAKVAHWAGRLGVQPRGFRVTSARTRFGSCSSRGTLCFSWQLMRYPEPAIDYVVLHEVAHLKQLNHSPAFYRLLDQHMPDHRARRALLKNLPTGGV